MKAGWALGIVFTLVLGVAGVCQTGLLGGESDHEPRVTARPVNVQEVFTSEAGWRYQRGQPSHWKFLMMKH
jgi:hypothetical protein